MGRIRLGVLGISLIILVCFAVISIPFANAQDNEILTTKTKTKQKSKITSELRQKIGPIISSLEKGLLIKDIPVKVYIELSDPDSAKTLPKYVNVEFSEGNTIQAKVPSSKILELTNVTNVIEIKSPHYAYPKTISEGVNLIDADTAHEAGIAGKEVKIAIIDGGFLTNDPEISSNIAEAFSFTGDITGGYTPGNSHGTAVAEIILDTAPNAKLYLYNIETTLEFNAAVDRAISKGVDIISISLGFDDLGPTIGPKYRDGTSSVALKLADAKSVGILPVVAAGNEAGIHWSGTFQDSGFTINGRPVHNFRPSATGSQKACLPISSGSQGYVILTWQDWPLTDQDYDLYVLDTSLSTVIQSSEGAQTGSEEPQEIAGYLSSGSYCVVIAKYDATSNASFHLYVENGIIPSGAVASGSLSTPADSEYALTVGAVDVNTESIESFSSQGPTDDLRNKPEICGPDNVSTSTYGYGSLMFQGTSAATPHVTGIAALKLQENPTLTVTELKEKIIRDAKELTGLGTNICGSGNVNFTLDSSINYISDLMIIFHQRPDLKSAFGEAIDGNLRGLLSWASYAGTSEYPSILKEYGHLYDLMKIYDERSDLRTAYPEANNAVNTAHLYEWAENYGVTEYKQSLAKYDHIYNLVTVYYSRPDLQSAYTEASNGNNLSGLLRWAGEYGTSEHKEKLGKYDHIYDLMRIYQGRSDLQSAFPEAANGNDLTNLLVWASNNGKNEDSRLSSRAYIYDLINVYQSRLDLQSAFPEASNAENLSNLLAWAGAYGASEHPSVLGSYDAIYDLMRVYNDRPDLQSAFPEAANGNNLANLYCWAKNNGVNEDSRLTSHSSFYESNC